MLLWDQIVDLLRVAIFSAAQVFGGNIGAGIASVTLLIRLALLPLTLRLARASIVQQEMMRRLKPELDAIRSRHKHRPEQAARGTQELLQRKRVSPFPLKGCLGTLAQTPLLLGLYSAVQKCVAAGGQFLWIPSIALPDFMLTLAVSAVTYLTLALGSNPADQNRGMMIVIPATITFFVLAKLAAGVGIYWGASSLVGLLQAVLLRRKRSVARASA
jgi:YidC/Oxa1 family membrane protein insertase